MENAKNSIVSDSEVTAQTALMWKYNPIPDFPEPYPEYKSDYEKYDGGEIIAARVRGKKHKHEGANCDDWYDFARLGDWVIAVVSDGAGSKPLSRIGARVSCEAVAASLKKEFSAVKEQYPDIKSDLSRDFSDPAFTSVCQRLAQLVRGSFEVAYSAVEGAYMIRSASSEFEEILGRRAEIKDYSATLLAAVIIPVSNKEHFVISVQIGDGMIASFNKDAPFGEALRILGNADSGSFAGETEFLVSEQARSVGSLCGRTKIQRGRISSLMLMTDGAADDYYPNNPQLLRLYTDLLLNGIIDFPSEAAEKIGGEITPSPVTYPWVNDSSASFSLQYAKNVMAENNIGIEELWENRFGGIVINSSLNAYGISNGETKAERLSVWLDNYVERGSFDDRTLFIINTSEK
ncbi:MAG: protein phosphatase 2C domain-containing protein [Oscillospiraceae bacterium]|nr:protein phosphatase 2C domain-containing protein [Oscillospiraceae bacterium]